MSNQQWEGPDTASILVVFIFGIILGVWITSLVLRILGVF